MVNLKDLWIGDHVRLKRSRREGRYEGLSVAGKARIRVGDKIILAKPSNIEIFEPPPPHKTLVFEEDDNGIQSSQHPKPANNKIDLHINILAPHLTNEMSVRILEYQLEAFKIFLDDAYEQNKLVVTVVHGKGEGVLKNHIQVYLQSDPRIKFYTETNRGGATEVWFEYCY